MTYIETNGRLYSIKNLNNRFWTNAQFQTYINYLDLKTMRYENRSPWVIREITKGPFLNPFAVQLIKVFLDAFVIAFALGLIILPLLKIV